jgi:hypothetical protein
MFWAPLLLALLAAVTLTLLCQLVFRWKGPWDNAWAFFAILFLACWSSALWIGPSPTAGRAGWWGAILIGAIFLAFGSASVAPPGTRTARVPIPIERRSRARRAPETPEAVTLNIFFWALVGLLALAIVWGLSYRPGH